MLLHKFFIGVNILLITLPILIKGQLHFASLGNWGNSTSAQSSVAKVLKEKGKEYGLSFIISPGSNFINGIESIDDNRWFTDFTKPFEGKDLHLPFFTVLGIDDWRNNYSVEIEKNYNIFKDPNVFGNDITSSKKIENTNTKELNVKETNEKNELGPIWTIPNWWYHYSHHFTDSSDNAVLYGANDVSALFIFIDTFIISEQFPIQTLTKQHWDYLKQTIEIGASIFDWVIVVGDKTISSSGKSKSDKYLYKTLRPLLKDNKVDAYISGVDYDMEILEDDHLTLINCGSGSSSDIMARLKLKNSIYYTSKVGFCHHKLTKKEFVTELIDGYTGEVLSKYVKKKNSRKQFPVTRFNWYKSLPKVNYIPCPSIDHVIATESDLFLRLCGTTGLGILFLLVTLQVATVVHKNMKD